MARLNLSVRVALIPVFVLLLVAGSARAASIRVEFAGVIDEVFDDFPPVFDGSIVPGTPFSGTLIYDDEQAPSDTTLTSARYQFLSPPWSYTLSIGNYAAEAGPLAHPDPPNGFQIDVSDSLEDSFYAFESVQFTQGSLPPLLYASLGFVLRDLDGTALAGTALSGVPLSLNDWEENSFSLDVVTEEFLGSGVSGHLTSLSVVVPEPGTAMLLALGCTWLGSALRRPR